MAVLGDDKLQQLHKKGRVLAVKARPQRNDGEAKEPHKDPERDKAAALKEIAARLQGLTEALGAVGQGDATAAVLREIREAILGVSKAMESTDRLAKAIEAMKPPKKEKRWVFSVTRDPDGKIQEIKAEQK